MIANSVPGTRDLYFIFHDLLCYQYQLIPPLYSNRNLIKNNKYNCYHEILFELSSYFDETETSLTNLTNIIKVGIYSNPSLNCMNILDGILYIIAEYSNYTPLKFNTKALLTYVNQLKFNEKLNTVIFSNARNDFLNIMSDENLLIFDCNGSIRIDTYIEDHKDEMWVGIIDKCIYHPTGYTDYKKKSIYYYDGRGRASITAFGNSRYKVLEDQYRYGKYDWISFCINLKQNTIIFYKNQNMVYKVDTLIEGDFYVYNGIVDRWGDGFFVEKVVCK
eukprot:486334_1